MSDLKDELQQERREKEWAETWKPDGPGDALIGTLEGYDRGTTDFGEYRVAHIRNEDGVLKGLWLMHSVLQDEWEEAGPQGEPQVGDRVGAMYHGQRSGDTYDYHMWSVKVDREATASKAGADSTSGGAEEAPQAADRPPQEANGREQAGRLYGGKEAEGEGAGESAGESTLDDPNGDLPF